MGASHAGQRPAVWQALLAFGAPLTGLAVADLHTPGIVFQMGLPPCRIDILTQISGVQFDAAWPQRLTVTVAGLPLPVIGLADLKVNKAASGRPKDLADLDALGRAEKG